MLQRTIGRLDRSRWDQSSGKEETTVMGEAGNGGLAVATETTTTAPGVVTQRTPSNRLRVAVIGVGGMGHYSVSAGLREHIAAICDVDDGQIAEGLKRIGKKQAAVPKVYYDYRNLLDECANQIDVVLIGTPD